MTDDLPTTPQTIPSPTVKRFLASFHPFTDAFMLLPIESEHHNCYLRAGVRATLAQTEAEARFLAITAEAEAMRDANIDLRHIAKRISAIRQHAAQAGSASAFDEGAEVVHVTGPFVGREGVITKVGSDGTVDVASPQTSNLGTVYQEVVNVPMTCLAIRVQTFDSHGVKNGKTLLVTASDLFPPK